VGGTDMDAVREVACVNDRRFRAGDGYIVLQNRHGFAVCARRHKDDVARIGRVDCGLDTSEDLYNVSFCRTYLDCDARYDGGKDELPHGVISTSTRMEMML